MTVTKQRLSVVVDADLLHAARSATQRGEVANISAWVNAAIEAEHGEIPRRRSRKQRASDRPDRLGADRRSDPARGAT